MNNTQRIIKYLAIAFAMFLIFTIIVSIMKGISSLNSVFSDDEIKDEMHNLDINNNISTLDIDVSNVDIIIRKGDKLNAETDNKNIKIYEQNNKLSIYQKKNNWLKTDNDALIIYVPNDLVFDNVSIEAGAGKIEIDKLTAKILHFELGAGKVNLNEITALNKAEIEGGAGAITLLNSNLNNLEFDMGIGKADINAFISGKSQIEAGVGEILLKLNGTESDYLINATKVIGNIMINNINVAKNSSYGTGSNIINIEGGVGAIKINFNEISEGR